MGLLAVCLVCQAHELHRYYGSSEALAAARVPRWLVAVARQTAAVVDQAIAGENPNEPHQCSIFGARTGYVFYKYIYIHIFFYSYSF